MRWLAFCLLVMAAGAAQGQSRDVDPADLTLSVTTENAQVAPYRGEMVLLTIHGIYRRHITRESLEHPDLEGFNWMQLGQDYWYDSQIDGRKVKNFKRRMALFPDKTGDLTIGPFVHHLTLTDETDNWFDHDIRSAPISISVRPAPPVQGWWFPVRRLEISDQWSNPPDQLAEGGGVLRMIRVTAVGASLDMIPPMPELRAPSAMIFPHPEKRFVELSPDGPVSIAFWRWTIRPTNSTSAILEPITFEYFDTTTRQAHTVTIAAQRVAIEDAALPDPVSPPAPVAPRPAIVVGIGAAALAIGLVVLLAGRGFAGLQVLTRFAVCDPLQRALRRAARRNDMAGLRRAAVALLRRDGPSPAAAQALHRLDMAVFGADPRPPNGREIAREILSERRKPAR